MPNKRRKRLIKLPNEYFYAIDIGKDLFSNLYQFENGLRLTINQQLEIFYGPDWWNISLKTRLPAIHRYAEEIRNKMNKMPYIGSGTIVVSSEIHLITLGHLEEIVKSFKSDLIPVLFPTIEFFLGHMELIKRVRNLYSHMFPCITKKDSSIAKREILTLSEHINSKII